MKKYVLFAVAIAAIIPRADAASFDFSFVNSGYGSTSVVTGVLDGLKEGSNLAADLTATVTAGLGIVPDGYVFALGTGTAGTFTVTAGQITYADAYFVDPNTSSYLFLGTDPFGTTYYPNLSNARTGAQAVSMTAPTFSPVAVAAVPEPATWAMMIGGFGMAGGALRRRRISTKVRFA